MTGRTEGRLHAKIAIITGATGGIGAACARRLLNDGASVMLIGRNRGKLEATCDALNCAARIDFFVAEAADEAAMAAAVATTVDRFGGVDILVANAGSEGVQKPLELQGMAEFEEVLRTNVIGVWLAMKHCIAPMRQRGGGSMIAMASMAGFVGFAGASPYIASKHAVCGLVKTAALELGPLCIRVNGVAPGPIENRMMRSIESQISSTDPQAVHTLLRSKLALGRYGSNQEVANLVAFLASDESSFCTGGIHLIDGGYCAA